MIFYYSLSTVMIYKLELFVYNRVKKEKEYYHILLLTTLAFSSPGIMSMTIIFQLEIVSYIEVLATPSNLSTSYYCNQYKSSNLDILVVNNFNLSSYASPSVLSTEVGTEHYFFTQACSNLVIPDKSSCSEFIIKLRTTLMMQ